MATLTSVFTSIANAIRGKNGSSDTYTPEEMATAISEIETGIDTSDATATAGDILATKTAYAVGEKVTGNMTNNGAVSPSGLNCGGSYTIPEGYHNGQGVVSANSLASQTGVDSGKTAVGAGQMVSGYQGWVNGSKVTGTFTGQEKSATPSTSSQNITPDSGKYLTKVTVGAISTQEKTITSSRSAQTVTPDSGKYLSKVTVNGLAPTGTYTASSRGASLDMGAASNYRYVNTNSVPNSNSGTYTFPANDTGETKDLGATNTYRYVNAGNVYAKGKADGAPKTLKYTESTGGTSVSVTNVPVGSRGVLIVESYNSGVINSITGCTYTYLGCTSDRGFGYSKVFIYQFTATATTITVNKTSPSGYQSDVILIYA